MLVRGYRILVTVEPYLAYCTVFDIFCYFLNDIRDF